jgi:hypothetical protein
LTDALTTSRVRPAILIAGGLFLLGGSTVQAARLLEIRVERDGQVVLRAMRGDDSEQDLGIVWAYLKEVELEPVSEIPVDPTDPLQSTLTGDLRVAILHGGTVVGGGRAEVSVRQLRLVRPSADSKYWQLAPGEVERTAEAAGIQLPKFRGRLLAVACGAAVTVVVVAWSARRRRRAKIP